MPTSPGSSTFVISVVPVLYKPLAVPPLPARCAAQAALKSIEAVSAGSDLHVLLAVRHFDCTVRQHGEGSALAGLARQALQRAHVARYGAVSPESMARLVALNRKLHVES
jgi:hypothetical protein